MSPLALLALLAACTTLACSQSMPTRTIRVVNSCKQTGWITVIDGAGSAHPEPSGGSYRVDPGQKRDFVWNAPYGQDIWSGNLGLCVNGTCSGTEAQCDAGQCSMADYGPQTRAEFTLQSAGSDFYDVTLINGVTTAMSITPFSAFWEELSDEDKAVFNGGSGPYWCGAPGALTEVAKGQAVSKWDWNPPSEYYNWVLSGGPLCNTTKDCPSGLVCGLSNNVGKLPQFFLSCGVHAGFWTGDEVCGKDMSFGAPFDCSKPITGGPGGTEWVYYGCTNGIPSCYEANAPEECCGCVDWWTQGVPVPPAPLTTACVNKNPEWVSLMTDRLLFLKAACPSCYVYPYDDVSSTFLCSTYNGTGTYNSVNYVVEICPDLK